MKMDLEWHWTDLRRQEMLIKQAFRDVQAANDRLRKLQEAHNAHRIRIEVAIENGETEIDV